MKFTLCRRIKVKRQLLSLSLTEKVGYHTVDLETLRGFYKTFSIVETPIHFTTYHIIRQDVSVSTIVHEYFKSRIRDHRLTFTINLVCHEYTLFILKIKGSSSRLYLRRVCKCLSQGSLLVFQLKIIRKNLGMNIH